MIIVQTDPSKPKHRTANIEKHPVAAGKNATGGSRDTTVAIGLLHVVVEWHTNTVHTK